MFGLYCPSTKQFIRLPVHSRAQLQELLTVIASNANLSAPIPDFAETEIESHNGA